MCVCVYSPTLVNPKQNNYVYERIQRYFTQTNEQQLLLFDAPLVCAPLRVLIARSEGLLSRYSIVEPVRTTEDNKFR